MNYSNKRVRIVVIALFVLAILFLWVYFPPVEWLPMVLEKYTSLGWVGMILFSLAYAVFTLFMIPGSLLTLAAGPLYGLWMGYFLVAVGSMGGVLLTFLVGKFFLQNLLNTMASRYPIFFSIREAIGQKGARVVFLVRLSPLMPFNLSNYLFSLLPLSLGRYLLASWLGMIPGTFLYLSIGLAGNEIVKDTGLATGKNTLYLIGLAATLLGCLFIIRTAKKTLEKTFEDSN